MPNELKLLSKEEAEAYLPELKRSMAIKKPIDTGNEWNYWERFDGRIEEGHHLINWKIFNLQKIKNIENNSNIISILFEYNFLIFSIIIFIVENNYFIK